MERNVIKYGIPYMGSKNRIAKRIVDFLPSGRGFYDIFCGGLAVSHCALLSGKYKRIYASDSNPLVIDLLNDAISGKFCDERRWISREEFNQKKCTDGYIKYIWSFGNKGRNYLYAKEIEPIKRALHLAVVDADYSAARQLELELEKLDNYGTDITARRMGLKTLLGGGNERVDITHLERLATLQNLEHLERLARLQNLEHLERLARLQGFQSIEIRCQDYQDVQGMQSDDVVYCDIPYIGTEGYGHKRHGGFNHDAFYQWALTRDFPVYISSYQMPEDFVSVACFPLYSTLAGKGNGKVMHEHIFVQRQFYQQCKTTLF